MELRGQSPPLTLLSFRDLRHQRAQFGLRLDQLFDQFSPPWSACLRLPMSRVIAKTYSRSSWIKRRLTSTGKVEPSLRRCTLSSVKVEVAFSRNRAIYWVYIGNDAMGSTS